MAWEASFLERASAPLAEGEVMAETDNRLIRNVKEEDWLARAMRSQAAVRVDEILQPIADRWMNNKSIIKTGVPCTYEMIAQLKKEMFQQVYATMGDEMMPEDMVRAIVVKTDRYHPYVACLLSVVTLGLFYLFRPRDDEGVIVLTKNERISAYRVMRHSVFESFFGVFKATAYVTMVFFLITIVPSTITDTFGLTSDSVVQMESFIKNTFTKLWEDDVNRFQRNTELQVVTYILFIIFFLFWMWTKFPHDYGTRQRQAHAADKVSCAQFCLSGGKWGRTCRFRLFFGRYPEQSSLDNKMAMRNFEVVGIANKEELSTTSGTNPFAGHTRRSLLIYGMFVYYCFMAIDVYLTYILPPITWNQESYVIQEFCLQPDMVESTCAREPCRNWVLSKEKYDPNWYTFCDALTWIPAAANETGADVDDANATTVGTTTEGATVNTTSTTGGVADEAVGEFEVGYGVLDVVSAVPARPRRVTADTGAEEVSNGTDANSSAPSAEGAGLRHRHVAALLRGLHISLHEQDHGKPRA
ncbi:unnamed protein product [Prorocentrum cordatum]|uniref:Uncharacterized protein n=1 Tax=Prorocentrum cordatum TaxID=2364126 RepID=A0ABN9T7U0_9DINO|nr:unnamed protein product [Polarella glacialis]